MKPRCFGLCLLAFLVIAQALLAQVPRTISYQGVLTDAGGIALSGPHDFQFRIFAAPEGGTALWTESHSAVIVEGGIFNVILGSVNNLEALDFDQPFFLEIVVGGSVLSPRSALTSAAYSLCARSVEDESISTDKIRYGAVTSDRIHDGAVSTVKIQDGAVTQAKLAPGLSLPPGGEAGGDLTGIYPNPTIASNAVTTAKIADGAATSGKIANNAITTAKIADGAVTSAKILDGTIAAADLANNAVTTLKMQDGAVTQDKLDASVSLPPGGTAGGDLTGTYPNPTVARIRGRSVATTAPSTGQVLKWTGSSWEPQDDGLILPFSQTNSAPISFEVVNTASSGTYYAVRGQSQSTGGYGVYGNAAATTGYNYGVRGRSGSSNGVGVYGVATNVGGATRGVLGSASSTDPNAFGVYCHGRFAASSTKSFQIDHPLDPANKYLNHYCTEGAEPLNVYSGNIVTDTQGYATVLLPDYFEEINRDFRYQLTVIDDGDDFVLTQITSEIQNNRFILRTSKPAVKVSWRVEAVRNDRYVERHGAIVESEKPTEERGKYLHPELYGLPAERGIYFHQDHEPIRSGE